ncbi:MAG: MOSC domain-containing protein [Thermoleophilia bacterium]
MSERVVSVNVGPVASIIRGDRSLRTGIRKVPVEGRVEVGAEGLAGDGQGNRDVHGGPHMAVYLYSRDDYDWWEGQLGRPLPDGLFGENLTVTGLRDGEVACGDRFTVGGVELEVTVPRLPCATLGAWMRDDTFPDRFMKAGRLGFYARVLRTGAVRAGDEVTRIARGPDPEVTVTAMAHARVDGARDRDALTLVSHARDTLHPRWVSWVNERLAALDRT